MLRGEIQMLGQNILSHAIKEVQHQNSLRVGSYTVESANKYSAMSYDDYSNYDNYSNYNDYRDYKDYDDYNNYNNYSNYNDYSDSN